MIGNAGLFPILRCATSNPLLIIEFVVFETSVPRSTMSCLDSKLIYVMVGETFIIVVLLALVLFQWVYARRCRKAEERRLRAKQLESTAST